MRSVEETDQFSWLAENTKCREAKTAVSSRKRKENEEDEEE